MLLQPRYDGRRYYNVLPTSVSPPSGYGAMLRRFLFEKAEREPRQPLGPFRADVGALAAPVPTDALHATWLGHSTVLLEIDGRRFLTDPVWAGRASPVQVAGPKRFFAPPLALADVPPLDGIILSHDHYDHLDPLAIRALAGRTQRFFCPLGVGAHLRRWGVPAAKIAELTWWESVSIAPGFDVIATPARHFSGRGLLDRDRTLWASWVVRGPQHRVFFGGDTGPFDEAFRQIGAQFGPFDLVLLEIGAADPEWADIHLGPDNALAAHRLLGGGPLLPLHWATFNLAFHAWRQPIQRLLQAAGEEVGPLLLPAPGQRMEVAAGPVTGQWWTAE